MARDAVTLPLPLERDIDIQQQLGNLTSYKLSSNCSAANKWKCGNASSEMNVIHVPGVGDLALPQSWTGESDPFLEQDSETRERAILHP